MRYMLKFDWEGETRFGVFIDPEIDEEAKEVAARGRVLVSDAELPKTYELDEDAVEDVPGGSWPTEDYDWLDAKFKAAMAESDRLDGLVPGKLFSRPVGDGQAWYLVTKVLKTRVDIEWRGYNPDRWTDGILGWGGRFDRDLIEPLVVGEERLRAIFGR